MDHSDGMSRRKALATTGAGLGAAALWLGGAKVAGAADSPLAPRGGRAYNAELAQLQRQLTRIQGRLGRLAEVASDAPEPVRPEAFEHWQAIAATTADMSAASRNAAAASSPR